MKIWNKKSKKKIKRKKEKISHILSGNIKNALYRPALQYPKVSRCKALNCKNFWIVRKFKHVFLYIVWISIHCIVRCSNYHFWKYLSERLFAEHLFPANSYPQETPVLIHRSIICGYYTKNLWISQYPVDNFLWITFFAVFGILARFLLREG